MLFAGVVGVIKLLSVYLKIKCATNMFVCVSMYVCFVLFLCVCVCVYLRVLCMCMCVCVFVCKCESTFKDS